MPGAGVKEKGQGQAGGSLEEKYQATGRGATAPHLEGGRTPRWVRREGEREEGRVGGVAGEAWPPEATEGRRPAEWDTGGGGGRVGGPGGDGEPGSPPPARPGPPADSAPRRPRPRPRLTVREAAPAEAAGEGDGRRGRCGSGCGSGRRLRGGGS